MKANLAQLLAIRAKYKQAHGEDIGSNDSPWSDDAMVDALSDYNGRSAKEAVDLLHKAVVKARVAAEENMDDDELNDAAEMNEEIDERIRQPLQIVGAPQNVRPIIAAMNSSSAVTALLEQDYAITVQKKILPLEMMDTASRDWGTDLMRSIPRPNTYGRGVTPRKSGWYEDNNPAFRRILRTGKKKPGVEDFFKEAVLGSDYGKAILNKIAELEKGVAKKVDIPADKKADAKQLRNKLVVAQGTLKRAISCWHVFDDIARSGMSGILVECFKRDAEGERVTSFSEAGTWERRNEPIVISEVKIGKDGKPVLSAMSENKRFLTVLQFSRLNVAGALQRLKARTEKTDFAALMATLDAAERKDELKVTDGNYYKVLKGFTSFVQTSKGRDKYVSILVGEDQSAKIDMMYTLVELKKHTESLFAAAEAKEKEYQEAMDAADEAEKAKKAS